MSLSMGRASSMVLITGDLSSAIHIGTAGKGWRQRANVQPLRNHAFPEEEYRTSSVKRSSESPAKCSGYAQEMKRWLPEPTAIFSHLLLLPLSLLYSSLSPGFGHHVYTRGSVPAPRKAHFSSRIQLLDRSAVHCLVHEQEYWQ